MKISTHLPLLFLILSLPSPSAGKEPQEGGALTFKEVSDACKLADANKTDPRSQVILPACELTKAPWPSAPWSVKLPKAADFRPTGTRKAAPTKSATAARAPSPTAILWGTTQFLMARAEQELRLWAVDRMFDGICAGVKVGPSKAALLLPETCALRDRLHFAGMAGSPALIREAVRRDLLGLPAQAFEIAAEEALAAKDATRLETSLVLLEAAIGIEETIKRGDGREGFAGVAVRAKARFFAGPATPIASTIRNASAVLPFMPPGRVSASVKDEAWATALLAATVSAADDAVEPAANSPWERDAAKVFSAFDGTRRVADALEGIDEALGRGVLDLKEEERAKAVADLAKELVRTVAAIADAKDPARAEQRADVLTELQAAWKALSEKDYFGASAHVLQGVALVTKEGPVQRNLLRSAALAMDVAAADDADSVEAALNRFAAPAGSYVGKHRGSSGYFNVNAYFGAFGGREQAKQRQGSWGDAEWGWTAGAWAPIGFEWGCSTEYGSFGLFGQVVDLGVLASYRMAADEDQLASPPAVGFQEVVSPGAYLVWGIRDWPLSVAAGASLTPSLRKVGSAPDEKRDAWRWGVAVGVDIPVFP